MLFSSDAQKLEKDIFWKNIYPANKIVLQVKNIKRDKYVIMMKEHLSQKI